MKDIKSNFFIAAVFILLVSTFVHAQNAETIGAEGSEQPFYHQSNNETGNACYVYEKYVVMTYSSEDVGEEIKVYKRGGTTDAKKECTAKRSGGMTFQNTDANYFFGLTGDKILIDKGTSAGRRGLDIISLKTEKILFSTVYQGSVKVVENYVTYDKPSKKAGLLKNCPNAAQWKKDGGGVGWILPTKIDLTTFKETSAGRLTCVYVE